MLKRLAAAAAATGAAIMMAVAAGGAPAQAATSADTYAWCEEGYVCIYGDTSWNRPPILKFYTYGAHNLNNVLGAKRIFNNQTGGALAQVCDGYNGTNCGVVVHPWTYWDLDFTPINSVRLYE
ncbi:hypothetical protein Asp14428_16220 [Actinoplanes sp. NBRC 14428]|nr:hypothetical protein [Pseudosporangium ferrugineum]BCJ50147.1 hypothetical protein Asp14428_16220 [Actinoplanes sp. NBRC 14428]